MEAGRYWQMYAEMLMHIPVEMFGSSGLVKPSVYRKRKVISIFQQPLG